MIDFKKEIERVLKKHIKEVKIEIPPQDKFGDFAVPLFEKDVKEIQKIKSEIEKDKKIAEYFSKISVVGKYINFFVNEDVLKSKVFSESIDDYKKPFKDEIVVEYGGPNLNKPLHIGHALQYVVGNALCNLIEFTGIKTRRVNLLNDRGIGICEAMLGYKKFGKNSSPDIKSDHFVGNFYVLFNKEKAKNPKVEEEVHKLLKKYEKNDKETISLWKKLRTWSLTGLNETEQRFGVKYEKIYYESDFYEEGVKSVLDLYKKKLLKKDENKNIIADLEDKKLGMKVLLREDGTAVYATQDIILAKLKRKDFPKASKYIVMVSNEQKYYFTQLAEIYKIIGYNFPIENWFTGYVTLPEGKMKSREGRVVDADDLLDHLKDLAKFKIKENLEDEGKSLPEKEINDRSEKIAIAALKFYLLNTDMKKDIIFDPDKSVAFEGDTGPYILYTIARINSIMRKAHLQKEEEKIKKKLRNLKKSELAGVENIDLLKEESELKIIKMLSHFENKINDSAENYKPSILTRYLLDLCAIFNEYYHSTKVIQDDKKLEAARLALLHKTKTTIMQALDLLGIPVIEEM